MFESSLESNEVIETALLNCPKCRIKIPVIHGFPLFQEQFLTADLDLDEVSGRVFGRAAEYVAFLELKKSKPAYDLYAAFQPFNESTQAIFPLLPFLHQMLRPGDLILDLWCRTGWTGEFLASIFPEQEIISIWEGFSGLLGAKGFQFWLGSGKRRKNLDIIFHSPNDPLPFPDQTFRVVHGLDTLHRYHHVPLISECLRVVQKNGCVIFPHVHLTNSEPEPYFDRGEDQLHGLQYERYFRELFQGTNWKGYVLSEKRLFDATNRYQLIDEPQTDHYNSCILLTDQCHEQKVFVRSEKHYSEYENAFAVLNPLYSIDFIRGLGIPSPEAMDGGGQELFFRHPMYHSRLLNFSPVELDQDDLLILFWAQRLKTVSEICNIIQKGPVEIFRKIQNLEMKEILQIQNISMAMARLQQYYRSQNGSYLPGECTLVELWQRSARLHRDKTFLIWTSDQSEFTYGDADTIIRMAASLLRSRGLKSGDRVLIDAISHPEFIFAFWGAILIGAVVAPINADLTDHAAEEILSSANPKLYLYHPVKNRNAGYKRNHDSLAFGVGEDSDEYKGSFSEELGAHEPLLESVTVSENDPAVILFTSGSTGKPKGVVLSHGAIFRSSEIIDRAYSWKSNDKFLGGGRFHTMSGLRNPCVSILHSGAATVLPGLDPLQSPLEIMKICVTHSVTVLNVTPAFLAFWGHAISKASYFHDHHLRMVLSTGASLRPGQKEIFEKHFSCPVYDYYGLTETSGACILVTEKMKDQEHGIGQPWGCMIKVLNESGEPVPLGMEGELAIYTENLMNGYLGSAEMQLRNSWLLTGDLVRLNEAGCVLMRGRKDRMMIDKNGENVYPEDIEREINQVHGVVESYVTYYEDEAFSGHITAFVTYSGHKSPEELSRYVRNELADKLPTAHIPSLIIGVKEIPRGASGKVSAESVRQIIASQMKT